MRYAMLATRLAPTLGRAHYQVACVHESAGRLDLACEAAQRASECAAMGLQLCMCLCPSSCSCMSAGLSDDTGCAGHKAASLCLWLRHPRLACVHGAAVCRVMRS